jgi:hypothetical protein
MRAEGTFRVGKTLLYKNSKTIDFTESELQMPVLWHNFERGEF